MIRYYGKSAFDDSINKMYPEGSVMFSHAFATD